MSESKHQMFWREHLNNIEKMRCERNAPVDFMGCEQICDKSAAPEVSIVLLVIPAKAFAGDYVITGVCLSVCSSVCYHDN